MVKITALPASSGIAASDYMYVIDDTGGTPASQRATFSQVLAFVESQASAFQSADATLDLLSALTDPNADRIVFWDDSAGAYANLSLGSKLSITGTTLSVSADAWSDNVNSNIVPDADGTRDLGSNSVRFANAYADAVTVTNNITVGGTVDGRDIASDGSKLDAIEAGADVTDATNVAAAGALMDSEVTDLDGIKSLTVPNNTTISAFGATLTDDANAAAARVTLGVVIGTDVQAFDAVLDATTASFTTALLTKLNGIEANATADQSDTEIETAYNNQVAQVSSPEISAGTSTGIRRFTPADIKSMVDAHAPGGGGGGDSWNDAVDADIIPDADGTRDLGSTANRFAFIHVDAIDLNGVSATSIIGKTAPTGDVIGTTDTQTLTNKTLTTPVITLNQSASPAPTASGDIQWDSSLNQIVVGNGSSANTFSDDVTLLATTALLYEPINADLIKADTGDNLTAGYTSDAYAHGTITSGTVTPAPATGEENFQTLTNGGAFTLAPPASNCSVIIQVTNNASAGTITTSGFTLVAGDTITTTDGDDFFFCILKVGSFSSLTVQALQ